MKRWLLALALAGCQQVTTRTEPGDDKGAAVTDPTAEKYPAPKLPEARVLLSDAYGGQHRVEVEVAHTGPSRERGLMWRTSLAEGRGMLFLFPRQEEHSFWMRNTLIPLDMLFIDRDKKVVGIVERAEPKTLVSRAVGAPSQFVLEVPGGYCEKAGIRAGSAVIFEGTSMIDVTW